MESPSCSRTMMPAALPGGVRPRPVAAPHHIAYSCEPWRRLATPTVVDHVQVHAPRRRPGPFFLRLRVRTGVGRA